MKRWRIDCAICGGCGCFACADTGYVERQEPTFEQDPWLEDDGFELLEERKIDGL